MAKVSGLITDSIRHLLNSVRHIVHLSLGLREVKLCRASGPRPEVVWATHSSAQAHVPPDELLDERLYGYAFDF